MSITTTSANRPPLEKDFSKDGGAEHINESREDTLRRIRTAGSITIPPEMFEKMYLTPANKVKGDLRFKFANPTPLGLVGFVIALTPLSCALMGWRGAGGGGAANIGPYYWFGGALQLISGVLEFFLGNTFPFVVLSSFGAFFLSFASTLTPYYNASAAYGNNTAEFQATFGFFPLFMGLLCTFYFICALRTNLVFVTIFFFLIIALGLLTAGHWQIAQAQVDLAVNIDIAAGATAFVSAVAGWYLLLSQLLQALEFPFQLPVGDLNGFIQTQKQNIAKKDTAHLV
ncbi:hypothetical protein OIDMADRAFT_172920 [Oidiodendron maius Zn]|uniref:GPR1/FUN34/YaaH-class plasma membrane protein n=1 Tax=Oidiodendron maius (strain Zn) TaxID=913774 RepID=A0A0C3CVS6_OIDMZ|nr:hypothetical protein OIDMADRAFT_172920 [Oidiodendron maius Zn]